MGQGRIPWYSPKYYPSKKKKTHRKRVTCELHDSYFRLVTIKHAIPKIEWAMELLYNSVKTGSQLVWRPVGENMLEWEHVPKRLGPQAPGWAAQETRTTQGDVRRGWGGQSPTPSHTQPFQIKWVVYFSKNCVARLYCVVVIILHAYVDVYILCVCIVKHGHGYC